MERQRTEYKGQKIRNKTPLWRDDRFWRIAGQVLAVLLVGITVAILVDNLLFNSEQQGVEYGLDFLGEQASFDIGETLIPYSPLSPYSQALLVGIANTLRVIVIGIILATIGGVIIGFSVISDNWLVRQLAIIYVETIRNTPLLLQLFFWYFAVFLTMPVQENSISLLGFISLSNRGVELGSIRLSSEFCALLVGLTVYTAAFIAEIVRAGIQSVPRGQWEAAKALGIKPFLMLRLVVFPQALRVIIPPLTSEYLNLAKNSSLAIAIAYPDIYSVYSTTLNQTGRSVEVIVLLMGTYLAIDLLIAGGMNLFNNSVQIKER
ncbi:amino acid ABC transporter permease [Microcoleus sp. FACHB-672]|uniref:amino acid ABC transporter permease n=1 Tax=Microcoleus sp. FACHB-672 TaxID=2692825 RepID=UPI0016876493|nr:ABC transporter permease subunit [Microcoleus sp. FACHB-672]MBD2039430.1 ABC transporter permease subunit [Microcoleus sp. FACHB-672]